MRLRRSVLISCFALIPYLSCSAAQKQWWVQMTTYRLEGPTAATAACIKGVESGDYQEHSHPSEGSGAFQFIPSTWQTWFGRWRDAVEYKGSDYEYAYQAPPLIQDAVLAYTLTNGGAGNWSGIDGCTGH